MAAGAWERVTEIREHVSNSVRVMRVMREGRMRYVLSVSVIDVFTTDAPQVGKLYLAKPGAVHGEGMIGVWRVG